MGERLADAMLLLRDFFNKRPASTVLGCFRAQDFDRSGKFELKEFALALKAFGFQMSDEDYELVFNWFDKDGSGIVELRVPQRAALRAERLHDAGRHLTLTLTQPYPTPPHPHPNPNPTPPPNPNPQPGRICRRAHPAWVQVPENEPPAPRLGLA